MPSRNKERMFAELDGEFLVFVIELQVHRLWAFWRWVPVVRAMSRMLFELLEKPEYGLLNFEYWFAFRKQLIMMYWRSFEHMHDWALNKTAAHVPSWKMLNQLMNEHPDLLGFWHESYVVQPNEYEAFYRNVPTVGLGKAGQLHPLVGRATTAAKRLRTKRAKATS